MKRRNVYSLRWSKKDGYWVLKLRGCDCDWVQPDETKQDLLYRARHEWIAAETEAGNRSQLRVYGKNGRIQFEHTYPRSSDPKRSKG